MDEGNFLTEVDDKVFNSPGFCRESTIGDVDLRRAALGLIWLGAEKSEGVLGCEKEVMA